MAGLPNNDGTSLADRLAGGLPSNADNPIELTDEIKPDELKAPEPKPDDERWQKIESRQNQLEMENQFLRGKLSQITQARSDEPEKPTTPEEIKPLAFNAEELERIKTDIDARGPAALVELLHRFQDNADKRLEQRLIQLTDNKLDERFTRQSAEAQRSRVMQVELQKVQSEVGDLLQDDNFTKDLDGELLSLLKDRYNRDFAGTDFNDPRALRLFMPGDIKGATMTVYNRWLRSGKAKLDNKPASTNGRPLREIVRTVSSDSFGQSRANANRAPTTIDELSDLSESEKRDAKAVLRKLSREGITEKDWVDNYLAGQ